MTNILRLILFLSLIPLAFAPALASEKPPIPGTRASQLDLVRDSVFYSVSLKREMRYRVLIPRDYEKNGRVRVLYLLHGLYGDYRNWDSYTGLQNYDGKLRLLIVMPDADDAWYTNSATVPLDRFEDYIVKDLISEIDEKYKTIRAAKGRAIAGLSMGGYGAVKLGLKYPQLFAFVGSLSGALNAAQNLDIQRPEFRPKLREVFGDEGSRTRGENDIFQWQSNCHPEVLITSITKLLVDILGHIGIAPYCFSLSASKRSFSSEAQAEENFGCACRVSTPDYFPAKPGSLAVSAWRNPAA